MNGFIQDVHYVLRQLGAAKVDPMVALRYE